MLQNNHQSKQSPVVTLLLTVSIAFAQAAASAPNGTAAKKLAAIPFVLDTNLIFVPVSVNGSEPLSFILDTGSYSMLSTSRAIAMGLDLQRVGTTNGIGANQQSVYLVNGSPKYGPPGAALINQRLLAVPLAQVEECFNLASQGEGDLKERQKKRSVDGILGKEFFSSYVIEIDYQAKIFNVFESASYRYEGRGERFNLEIEPQHIFVRARVKAAERAAIACRLQVDTGYATAVVLTKEFVAANKLLPPPEKLKPLPSCGLAGLAKNQSWGGTLERLELGSFRIDRPATEFSQQPFNQDFDGFLGEGSLMRFKVIFDYSRSEMILENPAKK